MRVRQQMPLKEQMRAVRAAMRATGADRHDWFDFVDTYRVFEAGTRLYEVSHITGSSFKLASRPTTLEHDLMVIRHDFIDTWWPGQVGGAPQHDGYTFGIVLAQHRRKGAWDHGPFYFLVCLLNRSSVFLGE